MNVRHGRRALLAATLIVMASGCGPRDRLDVDERYSEQLSIGSAEYARVARSNAAATVEVVQVYAPGGSDGISLREATEGRLLYESRVPAEIESLFEALQIRQVRGECELGDGPAFIVIAYDRDLPRVGILRLYDCRSESGSVIGVRPAGDVALGYFKAAASYLRGIGVLD